MDSVFKIKERGSSVSTELRAGLVTFITMAYILPVNSAMLANAGLDNGAVFVATALSAAIGTLLMGLFANLPFAQASGMGLNAYFTFSVVIGMGVDASFALAAVFTEGIIFILLSLTNIRSRLLKAIPAQLRIAIAASIGLFIAFIGMQSAKIIVGDPATLVAINPHFDISVWLSIIGLTVGIAATIRGYKGSLLISVAVTTALGIIAQLTGLYVPNPDAGVYSLFPSGFFAAPPSLAPTFGLFIKGFSAAFKDLKSLSSFGVVVLSFLYVDIFDTLGCFTAVMVKTGRVDSNGEFEGAKQAFLSDALATAAGAVLGTSTVTTYIESSAGIQEGGATGLTAVTVSALFIFSLFFYPLIGAIQSFATAPALIIVGIMMMSPLADLEWDDISSLAPSIVTMIFMIYSYSISTGIIYGVLSFIICTVAIGKFKEIKPIIWVLGALFLAKIIFMGG